MFLFSTLLFLSGYILQQQTVRSIQAVIKPPPEPTPSLQPLSSQESSPTDNVRWEKVAHVQILQRHQEICSTAIIFAKIAQYESLAKRVVLYPQAWEEENGQSQTKWKQRNMRLLRKAASRYKISLHAIEDAGSRTKGASIPLSRLLSLVQFERVLYLPLTGVVMDVASLDSTFTIDMNTSATHLVGGSSMSKHPKALMAKPSLPAYDDIGEVAAAADSLEEFVAAINSKPVLTTSFLETGDLGFGPPYMDDSDLPESLKSIAYMRFTDPEILGPEFDIPQDMWMRAKPVVSRPRKAWEDTYNQYRGDRMSVCGLDLEPLPAKPAEHVESNGERLQL